MTNESHHKRWGIAAVVAITLLAVGPQLWFIVDRGNEWRGSNAITHTDEVAYSAYIASLIRGRPRRNDPFTGRQDTATSTTPESLFSIQMFPAYLVAIPAKLFGASASAVFIVAPAICAVLSSLAIFWMVSLVSGDRRVAATAACVVLGFGTLLAGQGMFRYFLTRPFLIPQWISDLVQAPSVLHLPFLRFYQPAIGFPLFFLLCGFSWLALTTSGNRKGLAAATAAALTFPLLVFTYFFLWTAAAAWLICLFGLWLIFRRKDRKRTLTTLAALAATAIPSLTVYFWLLSQRAATVDEAQALIATHRPDFFRFPEIVSLASMVFLVIGVLRGRIKLNDKRVLFTGALALSTFVVFNQQIVTGRSLQPFHYEWFISNYCAGLALLLGIVLFSETGKRTWLTNRRLLGVALIALVWASGEVWLAATLNRSHNNEIDDGHIVAERLRQLSASDGTLDAEQKRAQFPVVLMSNLQLADRLPTDAPQVPLWAPHMLVFPGVTEKENRERFFKQLYYLGMDEAAVYRQIDRSDWTFLAGFFPYHRLSPVTRGSSNPITADELRTQVSEYVAYAKDFRPQHAGAHQLSYLVVEAGDNSNLANIDRWYERDGGEVLGKFVLYRLKLRG